VVHLLVEKFVQVRGWFCMMLRKSLVLLALFTLVLINVADARPRKANNGQPQQLRLSSLASQEPFKVWIVVNLFTGSTSKQAVIVRDKLVQYGASGTGIVMPYSAITRESVARLQPAFLALSPNGIPWCHYKGANGAALERFFQELKFIVEEMKVPVIGICGGHQAIALAFGGKVGPIRGGEDDCFPYRKSPTERGRKDVYVIQSDSLFAGMGKSLNLVENHFDEVKRLPPGFVHLAGNGLSPYQIIKHPTRPVYGVQAHTEYSMASRPDGGNLLRNFLRIAQMHNRTARHPEAGAGNAATAQETKKETATEPVKTPEASSPTDNQVPPPASSLPDQAGLVDAQPSESIAQHSIR
jgi:GMP synthase (glutamine-hydrolysing)